MCEYIPTFFFFPLKSLILLILLYYFIVFYCFFFFCFVLYLSCFGLMFCHYKHCSYTCDKHIFNFMYKLLNQFVDSVDVRNFAFHKCYFRLESFVVSLVFGNFGTFALLTHISYYCDQVYVNGHLDTVT